MFYGIDRLLNRMQASRLRAEI